MNPEAFAKEIAKYQVVRRSDYCKSRVTTGNATFHKSGAPKPDDSRLVKVVTAAAEDDFWTLMDKSSAKILNAAEHIRFMSELKKEQRRVRTHVNLDILEKYASKC